MEINGVYLVCCHGKLGGVLSSVDRECHQYLQMQGKEKLKNNPKEKQKLCNQMLVSPCMSGTHQIASNQIWLQQCTIPSSQISACKNNGKHVKKMGEILSVFFSLDKKWILVASVQIASDVEFMLISTSG